MNRILFEKSEIADGVARAGGERARHVATVLKSAPGDTIKTGEIDGPAGTGEILSLERVPPETDPCGWRMEVRVSHGFAPPAPWFDLVLAPPRPRVFKRLLPQLAALGAGSIALVGAAKVEKDFWGATILEEEIHRPLLADGLMQAGTTAMPRIFVRRNLKRFLEGELESFSPLADDRVLAHPGGTGTGAAPYRGKGRLLLAIGPEGGWTDAEIGAFEERGFRRYSLGGRVLRTDTAAIALISKLNGGCR